nr:MAG TPA: hypothetical protein [Bacteriophage sp.]
MKTFKNSTEVINAYAAGELTLAECNEKLKAMGSGLMLDPNRVKITPEMAEQGWGLLDTGTGSLDPVQVKNGELIDSDMGEMAANILLKGKWYEVKGKKVIF